MNQSISWDDFLNRQAEFAKGEVILQHENSLLRGPIDSLHFKDDTGVLEIGVGWLAIKQDDGKFRAYQSFTTIDIETTYVDSGNTLTTKLYDIGEGRVKFTASKGYEYLLLPRSNTNRLRVQDLQRPS